MPMNIHIERFRNNLFSKKSKETGLKFEGEVRRRISMRKSQVNHLRTKN